MHKPRNVLKFVLTFFSTFQLEFWKKVFILLPLTLRVSYSLSLSLSLPLFLSPSIYRSKVTTETERYIQVCCHGNVTLHPLVSKFCWADTGINSC